MWKTASALIGIVLALLAIGIVMLASASAAHAEAIFGHPGHFVRNQAIWMVLGLGAAGVAMKMDYHSLRWWAAPLAVLCVALLIMTLIPGVGIRVKGSSRWLRFGPINLQPSELAKFCVILFLAWWMKREQRHAGSLVKGFLVPGGALGIVLALIFLAPDFGTTLLLAAVGGCVMIIGGARLRYALVAGAAGLAGFAWAVMRDSIRMNRVLSFLDRERYAEREAYQLTHSIYAFVVGGLRGTGFAESLQKRFYLPEAHTDFIFAIIGEELGLFATLGILLLFLGFGVCGMIVAFRAPDLFGRLLAFGFTLAITLQAMINIGVVTGSVPTTGLTLPFISYGGSSLVICMAMTGVLINIARHAEGRIQDDETRAPKDRVHRF